MDRYEYKFIQADIADLGPNLEGKLNALGDEGWRLMSTVSRERHGYSHEVHLILMRPTRDAQGAD